MDDNAIRALRLERQRLLDPVAREEEYAALFRLMQPVKAVAFSCPGDPPCLTYRCAMGDRRFTDPWRAGRVLVKGRFQNGTVGYIFAEDWDLYAAVYRRPADLSDPNLRGLYELLSREAPMTIRQIKETTGMPAKAITPLLHKLQQAFLVYEDQTDSDWERGWYLFSSEFPGVDPERIPREEAIRALARRLLEAQVFVDASMLRDYYAVTLKEAAGALAALEQAGETFPVVFDGRSGFVHAADRFRLEQPAARIASPVFSLHLNDPLVKANASRLHGRFAPGDVLQYLFMDGEFVGAVTGKWRQGPHDLWEIRVALPPEEAERRREEIREAVRREYPHLEESGCGFCSVG